MSNEGNEFDITVPSYRIDDVIQAAARSASATVQDSEITDLGLIPNGEVNPEDVGALSLRYVDGVPQLVISGGTVIPAALRIVDQSGTPVATYTAGPLPTNTTRAAVTSSAPTQDSGPVPFVVDLLPPY
ncbi:hypothetical protein [Kitasatospora griseola]|uniref:hypothetical protein n=1 Tax=Kitasatospora griseola TaxID=2064 RepID=UPI0037FCF532